MSLELIYHQHHHLAITLVSPMVRAWAFCLVVAGNLQVKGAPHRQSRPTHLPYQPIHCYIAGLLQYQKGEIIAQSHSETNISSSTMS